MNKIDELVMDAYYKVVPMHWAYSGAEQALSSIIYEVKEARTRIEVLERVLRKLERDHTGEDYEGMNVCL